MNIIDREREEIKRLQEENTHLKYIITKKREEYKGLLREIDILKEELNHIKGVKHENR